MIKIALHRAPHHFFKSSPAQWRVASLSKIREVRHQHDPERIGQI
jgi:hypothetical protein